MTQYWHDSTSSAICSFGSSSEPRIIGLPVDTPRDRRWLLLLLIGLRVNESVFEPETAKLHSVNAHYHLLNCVCSTHQQTSLQLLSSMIIIIRVVIDIQVEVSSLVVFDLSDLSHDFFSPHDLAQSPSLNYGPYLLHYVALVVLRGEKTVNLQGSDALSHVPSSVKLLNLGSTFVDVYLKHLFTHALYLNEAIPEALGDVEGENSSLISLKKEVKLGKSIKTATNNESFKILLYICGSLIHGGLNSLILV